MPHQADDDATVVTRRPAPPPEPQKPRLPLWAKLLAPAALLTAAAGTTAYIALLPSHHVDPPKTLAQPPPEEATPAPIAAPPQPKPPPPPEFLIEAADEAHMLQHVASDDPAKRGPVAMTVFRLAANPNILVLDFASLRDQGRMLNRAAAFIEKAGLPRDRVLTDASLDAAIRARGDQLETFYYGHDYGSASLVNFFRVADRDNIALLPEEEALRRLLRQEGWFEPAARAGLISIPRVGSDANVTQTARASILHHELSHGEYFANADYAAFVRQFWSQVLTQQERERVRHHLRSLDYDIGIDEMVENEAQAYLMFTYDPEFFAPKMIGMPATRLHELRSAYYRTMPSGWLRDNLGQYLADHKPPPPEEKRAAPATSAGSPAASRPR